MKKKLEILDYIKSCLISKESSSIASELKFFDELLLKLQKYYAYKDIEKNTNHYDIFNMLYIKKGEYSFDFIANQNNITIKTLYRYRKEYNDLAIKIIQLITIDTKMKLLLKNYIV